MKEQEKDRIAESGSGHGVRGDATGIVVGHGGDRGRTKHGQQRQNATQPATTGRDADVGSRVIWLHQRSAADASSRSSG